MNEEEKREYEDLQYQKYAIEQTLIDITDDDFEIRGITVELRSKETYRTYSSSLYDLSKELKENIISILNKEKKRIEARLKEIVKKS